VLAGLGEESVPQSVREAMSSSVHSKQGFCGASIPSDVERENQFFRTLPRAGEALIRLQNGLDGHRLKTFRPRVSRQMLSGLLLWRDIPSLATHVLVEPVDRALPG
jgi:hypothetical protein